MIKVLAVPFLLFAMASNAFAQDTDLEQLSWLIGTWEYQDKQLGGGYEEVGVRQCAFVFDKRYIRCESNGTTNSGKSRTYIWFLNYNALDQRFEMTGVFSDYPRKLLYSATVSNEGHRVELENKAWLPEGVVPLGTAVITYNGDDQYVWEISSTNQGTGETTRFRDTANRIKEEN